MEETETYDVEFLLETLGKEKLNVLEVACGSGRILVPLARAGHNVTGFDCNDEMLALLPVKTEGLSNIRYYKLDAVNSDWGSNYDVVVEASNLMINIIADNYLEAQKLFISKAAKALKSGGHIYLEFNLFSHPEKIFNSSQERVIFTGEDDYGVYGQYKSFYEKYDAKTQMTERKIVTEITLLNGEHYTFEGFSRKYIPTLAQIHSWLDDNGFEIEFEYGDFNKNQISDTTSNAIIWAKKL